MASATGDSKSTTLANALLNKELGATDYSAPVTHYLALYTAAPTDAGGGTEVSGGSYARVAITNNTTKWPNASGGSKSNGEAIAFTTPTAAWGTVTHWALHSHATNDAIRYWGALAVSQVIASGNPVSIAIGALVITET